MINLLCKKNIAVIIPTADRTKLLNRAIESVLRQTVKPSEIIVVDNGLNDANIEGDSYKFVKLIRTKPKIGPGKSRNIGALHASTYYLGFLDDDDIWEAEYIEHSLNSMNREDADAVVGQLKRKKNDGVVQNYKLFPSEKSEQRSVYYKNPGFGGQNFIIKKSFFQKIGGFDEEMPASVDRDLAARIIEHGGKILVQPLSIAILCDHDNTRVRKNIVKGNIYFIKKHWKYMSFSEIIKALKTVSIRFQKSIMTI